MITWNVWDTKRNVRIPHKNFTDYLIQFKRDGIMKASAAQFPSEIGKKAADAAYRLLEGEDVDRDILVPVKLITQENVEEFGTDCWQ